MDMLNDHDLLRLHHELQVRGLVIALVALERSFCVFSVFATRHGTLSVQSDFALSSWIILNKFPLSAEVSGADGNGNKQDSGGAARSSGDHTQDGTIRKGGDGWDNA